MLRVLCLLLVSGAVFVGCRPVPMQEEEAGGRRVHDVPNHGQPVMNLQPQIEKHHGDLPNVHQISMENPVKTRHNNVRIRTRRNGNDE